jgi:hypothetical protein
VKDSSPVKIGSYRSFLPTEILNKKLLYANAPWKVNCSPFVYSFAARVMGMAGCKEVIIMDGRCAPDFFVENSKFRIIGSRWQPNLKNVPDDFALKEIGQPPENQQRLNLSEKNLRNAVVVCSNEVDQLNALCPVLSMIKQLMTCSPVCLLTVKQIDKEQSDNRTPVQSQCIRPNLEDLRSMLKKFDLKAQFSGYTYDSDLLDSKNTAIAILSGNADWSSPKKDEIANFKVVAVMATFNEEDILRSSVMKLYSQGISTYIIDNWSTDSTFDIVKELESKGLLEGSERFPPNGPSKYFEYMKLNARIEEVTRMLKANWFISQDVDEIRESPLENMNLKEAIYTVDKMGYNAIDHTVIVFEPVDNNFSVNQDFEKYFKYFQFGERPGHFAQIKDWKNMKATKVKLVGHVVKFDRRKVFPYKFLLKHYPIRSQSHGERKVFEERKARFSPEERKRGMHVQYDFYEPGCSFLSATKNLILFERDRFNEEFLVERLSGISLHHQ